MGRLGSIRRECAVLGFEEEEVENMKEALMRRGGGKEAAFGGGITV